MINNCPKCGNPLQEGITYCPICGTNILSQTVAEQPVAQEQTMNVQPTDIIQPVVEQQMTTNPQQPMVEQDAPIQPVEMQTEQVQPVEPVMEQPVTPVQPFTQMQQEEQVQPVQETTIENIAPVVNPIAEQPVAENTTVEPVVQGTITPSLADLAPAIRQEVSTNPVPNVPASQIEVNASSSEDKASKNKKQGMSFNSNKKMIVAAVVAVVLIAVVGFFLSGSNLGKPTTQQPQPQEVAIETKDIITNGYKIELEEGWVLEEDNYNVIVKKEDDSVIIKFEHTTGDMASLEKENVTKFFEEQIYIRNVSVERTTISGKDTIIANCDYQPSNSATKYPVQYYYINGGTNLIIGATIIYQDETSKEENASTITKMFGTLTYTDESYKAVTTVNMYQGIFNLYSKGTKEPEPIYEEPIIEEPVNNIEG